MCCGSISRPNNEQAKQSEPIVQQQQSVRQADTGNPVNNQPVTVNSNNVTRANEVARNQYHQQHFGRG